MLEWVAFLGVPPMARWECAPDWRGEVRLIECPLVRGMSKRVPQPD